MSSSTWCVIGYAALLAAVVTIMFIVRERILTQFATPEAIAQWQAWREDVRRQQTEHHPVERRVPKSQEPPALLLMRDHFAVSLLGAVLFSSALYGTLAWFAAGTWNKCAKSHS